MIRIARLFPAGSRRVSDGPVKTVAKLLAPALLALSTAAATPDEISGKYCGTALSGGELVEVETVFETGADGLLSGTYAFADNGATTDGALREYKKQSDDTRTLVWIDKYGTGLLTIHFDKSRSSFDGLWGVSVHAPTYRWDGRRCETPIV